MASDKPNQKRKRGRPPVASKNADTASNREPQETRAEESSLANRRRGRPAKHNDSTVQEEVSRPTKNQPSETTQSQDTAPRKRGRLGKKPPDAEPENSRLAEKESNETTASPSMVSKKRGRAARNQDVELDEVETAETRPRKRTRGNSTSDTEKNPEAESSLGKKSGRKTNAPKKADVSETQNAPEAEARPKRRGRRAEAERPDEEAQNESSNQKEPSKAVSKTKGKTGRPAKQSEPTPEEPPARGRAADRRPRPSLAEVSVSKAQNKSMPPAGDETVTDNKRAKQKRRPGGPSTENAASASSSSKPAPSQQAQPESPPPPPPKDPLPFPHLTTLTRSIPRSTISSKWQPLPQASITQIQSIISDSARPVILRLRESSRAGDSTRQQQAQAILRTFSNRLTTKLVKGMPFPPPVGGAAATTTTKTTSSSSSAAAAAAASLGEQLDFEKTLDAIQSLERQLDPLLHSVALLKAEKAKEEALLEAEYRALKDLEGNARAQRSGWRERLMGKRKHGLVPPERRDHDGDDDDEDEEGEHREGPMVEVMKRDKKVGFGTVFMKTGGRGGDDEEEENEEDEEIDALARQIASHMESMKGNLGQIDGVVGEIAKGKAALQGVLGKYLSEEAYESVVLG